MQQNVQEKEKILWHQLIFMPFIGLQVFKVELFSENSLWSSILNHLQTKVTPKNPHSCFFSAYIILRKREAFFWKLTVEQYFKSLAKKSNSQEPPFLHIFFPAYIILRKWEFLLNVFNFRLADNQKSFNAAWNNIILHFFCSCYGFLYFVWNVKFSFF